MKRGTRAQWKRWVQNWQRSGLSAKEYAERIGVSAPSLYRWKSLLSDDSSKAMVRSSRKNGSEGEEKRPVTFVEVLPAAAPRRAVYEIQLSGGRIVRLSENFSAESLRRILAVLEESA